jgi:hypothetical protein
MATFDTIDDVKVFKTYKAKLKTIVGRIKAEPKIAFAYVDKFKFDDNKERALILIDHNPDLNNKLGKTPVKGKCRLDEAEKVVFEAPSTIHHDKVVKLFAEAGIARAVANPADGQNTPTQEPQVTTLPMKAGWSEMTAWGPDAQDLIDGFEGLVGVYRGLPEVKPAWTELSGQLDAIKLEMAEMVKSKVQNDKSVREAKLLEVKALTKKVRHLAEAIRAQALKDKQAPRSGGTTPKTPPQSETPTETPRETNKEPTVTQDRPPTTTKSTTETTPKVVAKPDIAATDVKDYVASNLMLGSKDSIEKYVGRAERALNLKFANVTAKHLEAVKLLAQKTYFPSDEPVKPETSKSSAPKPVIDWATRVLDTDGDVADLSSFNSTEKAKMLDIAMTDGASHHGGTALGGTHGSCLHWRLGDLRIFGNVSGGYFTLIGTGRHSGKGNSNYKVDLLLGGTTTATTA